MGKLSIFAMKSAILGIIAVTCSGACFGQSENVSISVDSALSDSVQVSRSWALPVFSVGQGAAQNQQPEPHQRGFFVRSLQRGLEDQKQLYGAPFKRRNLKWDALVLVSTAGLIAVDRQISRAIPNDHVNISHDVALTMLLGTGAAAGGTWLYGLRTGDRHADETGALTLESLANTFLIYTPMQLIAGRERPDEGTGNGRFLRHAGLDTSFPGGHAMFTWAMASVIAHEYPRRWVKIAAYGAAFSVSATRLTGRNHFASDIWVGSILGYLIGAHIFHAHCDPQFSENCHAR